MTTSPTKFDTDKPRYDLLPPKALGLLVDCLTYGAKKYDDYNWRKDGGIDPNRLFAATQRHLWAWKEGEANDKESGLPHLAHAATNLLMMLDLACRPPVKIPNFNPKPEVKPTHSVAFKWLEALGPLSSEFELLNAGKTISVCKADEPTRKAIKKLQHYKLLSDNQDVRVGLHESEYMVDITPVGWEVLKALKSHVVTKEPAPIVTTAEASEPEPEPKLIFGAEAEAFHWISRLPPGCWNYSTVAGPEDLVVLVDTPYNRRLADNLHTMFKSHIDEEASTITLQRTPAGHKIRSLLNAKS